MMTTFPELLKRTTAQCNRRGKPIAIAVLVVGCVSILTWLIAWRITMTAGLRELQTVLGPESTARIEQQVQSIGSQVDVQHVADTVAQEFKTKFNGLSADARSTMLLTTVTRTIRAILPAILAIGLLWVLLGLWVRACFFVLGAGADLSFGAVALKALRALPGLIALWFVMFCIVILWVPIIALLVGLVSGSLGALLVFIIGLCIAVYLGPRLSLAPVMYLQDRTGIIGSIKKSFTVSKGKWPKIFGNLLGAAAIVWVGTTVAQMILNLLIQLALPFSPYALFLNQIMTFVFLVGAAYRTMFLVRLKEAVAGTK